MTSVQMKKSLPCLISDGDQIAKIDLRKNKQIRYRKGNKQKRYINTNERTVITRALSGNRNLQGIDGIMLLMNIFATYVEILSEIYIREGYIFQQSIQKNS